MGHYPNSVNNRQLFYIIFLTLTTYTTIDLPKIMVQAAGRFNWAPIILSSIVFAFAVYMICKLNKMNEGKVLFDYGPDIVGKFFTYFIAVFYLIYFFFIGGYLKLKLVGLLSSNFLPLTPPYAMLLIGVPTFGYFAYKGITNVARFMELVGIVFLIVTLFLCIFMIAQGIHFNIMPFLNPLEIDKIVPAMKDTATGFAGIEILFVIPFTNLNKKAPKQAFKTLIFIGLLYVLIVESTVMILGINNTALLNDSFIEAIKIVELPVIERTDLFYLIFGLTSLFAGMIIVNVAMLEFLCKLLPKIKRSILAIATSILLFIYTLSILNIPNINQFFEGILPILIAISSLLIPTILFIFAKLKSMLDKKKVSGEKNE